MIQDINNLSIRNALITWCFEERVEDVRAFEIYFLSQELAVFGWPNLGGASNRGEPAPLPSISREEARQHLENAWEGLLLDFRQRVTQRLLLVRGIKSKPKRETEAVQIPGQWAADFRIDALHDTIELDDCRYVAVTVSSAAEDAARASEGLVLLPDPAPLRLTLATAEHNGSKDGTADHAGPPEAADAAEGAKPELAPVKVEPPRRPRGRPATAFLIEADLRAHWEAVQRRAANTRDKLPNWSELAAAMAKRIVRTAKQRGQTQDQKFPHMNTIRRRLPKLYNKLLAEMAGQ